MDRPPGRLTAPATCPGGRQPLARAPAWAAGVACPGSPPGIAAGSRGQHARGHGRPWARQGPPGIAARKGAACFYFIRPLLFPPGIAGGVSRGSRPPGIAAGAGGPWPGAAGRRMDRGRQQGPPVSRGPDYFSGAAGRRGRVHFDGRQGRGAPGRRGRDRAHAYTREHKTRVRPLPFKKIFLFPVGEYQARKTRVFPHGPFFCAMLFTSQGKRPAGDGGKPPKKFPEKNF